ncbi:MAG: hypothetical protein ABIH34_07280, partial [Nanoarchaeota archaeon]
MDYDSALVWFCPEDDCEGVLTEVIQESSTIDCAFFDLDLDGVISAFEHHPHARVVVDYRNFPGIFQSTPTIPGYMHNKFCVIDHR